METVRQDEQKVRKFDKVCEILEQNDYNPGKLIPILQAVQNEYKYLPEEILTFISISLSVSPAKVYGVATFFSHFALKPKGKYIIKVCNGTACHVKNSIPIINEIRKKLSLNEEKNTTDDLLFTLETVSCLGACGLAPVVLVNEDVHGQVTPKKMIKIIDQIIKSEALNEKLN
ncbi:MAG: NAD(P)H-dependent oxidoreductase subunit E [Candidatus Kapaibacterium sp.]